jgi:hypothetical protein
MLPLCYLANCWRGSSRQLSGRMSAMMVFAGLRGAIAFALAHKCVAEHVLARLDGKALGRGAI